MKRTALMTPAELDQLAAYRDTCLQRGLATGPVDRPAAETAVRAVYRTAGLAEPRLLVWMDSPLGGVFAAGILTQLGDQLRDQLRNAIWGGQELPWLAFYSFGRELGATYKPEHNARLDAMLATADLGWWWPYRGVVVLTDRPTVLHRDGQARLHHDTGPALAYPDGWAVWAWHGVRVPETQGSRP